MALAGCEKPPSATAQEPATALDLPANRSRKAAIRIRFDNGRFEVGGATVRDDRLAISAVFSDIDRRDEELLDGLVGESTPVAHDIDMESCVRQSAAGPAITPPALTRPHAWVQLLDVGNLALTAGTEKLPLRVQLVPAVVEATRGVRYDASVDQGRRFLAAGQLELRGTGGDGVPAFTAQIAVPRPVRITHIGAVSPQGGQARGLGRDEPLRLRWGSVDGAAELEVRVGTEEPGELGWLRCRLRDDGEFTVPSALTDQLPQRADHRPWVVLLVRQRTVALAGFANSWMLLQLVDGVHVY